jgi:hypothetical protein
MVDVERDIYDADKNYAHGLTQLGRDIVPADQNDSARSLFEYAKNLVVTLNAVGFTGNGFKIVPSLNDAPHDFYVTEGTGYLEGIHLKLGASVSWLLPSFPSNPQRSLHSVVSQVGGAGVQDENMNWLTNEHLGKTLRAQRKSDGAVLVFDITGNTEDYLSLSADPSVAGVDAGCSYCIVPKTVTVDRKDLVCLNVWVGNVDSREDGDLLHPIAGNEESMARRKMRNVITVVEDVDSVDPESDMPVPYVDANGDDHYFVAIGVLTRHAGSDAVELADMLDSRVELKDLDKFLMLDCTNGPLTGPLTFVGTLTIDGNLMMGDGRIVGDHITADFDSGIITAFQLTAGNVTADIADVDNQLSSTVTRTDTLKFPKAGVGTGIEVSQNPLRLGELTFGISGSAKYAQINVGFPRTNDHAVNKKYADFVMKNHRHDQYLSKESLEAMQAMLTPAAATALILAAHGTVYLASGDSFIWDHGLGTEYVIVQARSRNGLLWYDDQTILSYRVIDSNTVQIANQSVGNIQGADIMAVAFSVPTVRVISITDTFAVDAFGESVETLVTV